MRLHASSFVPSSHEAGGKGKPATMIPKRRPRTLIEDIEDKDDDPETDDEGEEREEPETDDEGEESEESDDDDDEESEESDDDEDEDEEVVSGEEDEASERPAKSRAQMPLKSRIMQKKKQQMKRVTVSEQLVPISLTFSFIGTEFL